jgi:hypothetical protein
MTFSPYINESLLIFDILKPELLDPNIDYTTISRGLLMFIDTNTGSIWNMLGEAIDGPLAGSYSIVLAFLLCCTARLQFSHTDIPLSMYTRSNRSST